MIQETLNDFKQNQRLKGIIMKRVQPIVRIRAFSTALNRKKGKKKAKSKTVDSDRATDCLLDDDSE